MKAELVRRAAAEHFDEGFMNGELVRMLRDTEPAKRIEAYEAMRTPRTVPDGCFTWIAHLVWLEGMLEITDLALAAEEAEGLLILKRERARFQVEHPACLKCGMPNEAHALRCRECMAELPR